MSENSHIAPMRLAKFLSHCGVCSRRQASRLIELGQVQVNGRAANHIDHVTEQDDIWVNGQKVVGLAPKLLYLYHKPVGIDCKLSEQDPSSLLHHLPKGPRVYPVGRLDKDSRGLLLLTNDGELCHALIHPDKHQEKEYIVKVDKPIDGTFCETLAKGVPVDGQTTLPCTVVQIDERTFKIVLKQGLNRQIRKMAKHCGRQVMDLYRVRIANLMLDPMTVPEGQYCQIDIAALVLSV
ncbi:MULTISPECIES: pseudouridine synthase [Pseudoalteromonas]|uniref:Pseudouridine synthase n=1 Tax=Pseudoalteromonas obscura TaxID=3048491 RepID=A0ABT7ERK7_9GAMM|nr:MULTISPECIES: pseudouridine synthase [Pseudoalteromonas]MDK2597681.1 pseudouridine synthase [Pseudoalteromonas sp. P94(2023)]